MTIRRYPHGMPPHPNQPPRQPERDERREVEPFDPYGAPTFAPQGEPAPIDDDPPEAA
jgi:hypothetical protein